MGLAGAGTVPDRTVPGAGDAPAGRLVRWVPALYALASAGWIAFSDAFVAAAFPSVEDVARWSMLKGFAFVAVTTAGLHLGLRWALRRERSAETALRSAQRRYELLAEHTRDIILFVRPGDGRILDANAAAEATYGWSLGELRGMTVYDLRAAEARAEAQAQLSAADAGGLRYDTGHRRRDGTTVPVEVNAQGAVLDGERVLVCLVRDVTERRTTEEALRESEERLALAIDGAGLGTFHAAPYGQMEWSPRCREVFGVGDAVIETFEDFLSLVHPEDREAVRAAAARWTDPAGDGRYQQQYRIVRPDGTIRWVSAHGKARFGVVDGVLRPLRLAGTIRDITEIKAVQAQLMQSDRLASVGMLAAGVAHEINNPLAYLSAALEFLHDHAAELSAPAPLRDELLRALDDARQGADRVRHVVRDLRTFSGQREERRARVELAPILDAAIQVAANELRYRARVVREFAPAPAVLADEARLGQVALNLLINAAQAIPEGRAAENEIRVVVGAEASGRAVFEILDTGCGIAPENLNRIFDPFFTTKPRGVGTGLGLPICRGIVQGLGGEIVVESRAEGGTRVRVALPPAPAPATAAAPTPAPSPRTETRRGRVLVVDDEPPVAAALRRLLAGRHEVAVSGSGAEALERIEAGERFDAVLCDLMMPGMTGMQLYEALLRVAPEQARRFIVLTGGAFTESARRFLDRTPVLRCEKPFDSADLRALVDRVVG